LVHLTDEAQPVTSFFIFLFFLVSINSSAQEKTWMLAPFGKLDSVNPVLTPGSLKFNDPILNKEVAWEEKYVFNPAAVVRNGKVYLLYRAEDTVQEICRRVADRTC
jgi:hypothetical protein